MRPSAEERERWSILARPLRQLWRRILRIVEPRRAVPCLDSVEAYRLWSTTYEAEASGVLLTIEDGVFRELLAQVPLEGRDVIDVGCGTGRHWGALVACRPRTLIGVDSSPEMLDRLRMRYPGANVHVRCGSILEALDHGSHDAVLSTMMLGHVDAVEAELREWIRLLRPGGTILLTDFHPDAAAAGMGRTFTHGGATFEVEQHLHSLAALRALFDKVGLEVVRFVERRLDSSLMPLFERQGHSRIFARAQGTPIIAGFLLRRA